MAEKDFSVQLLIVKEFLMSKLCNQRYCKINHLKINLQKNNPSTRLRTLQEFKCNCKWIKIHAL